MKILVLFICKYSDFNHYWQILENSSRIYSEISVFRRVTQTDFWQTQPVFFRNFNFRGMSWTDFWKIHPSIFCDYLFSFCSISGYELDRFLENLSILRWVFQKSVCVTPRNSSKTIFRLFALFWKSFPEICPCHAPKF